MKYDILLWDVDDTLLDFGLSEKYAIKHCFDLIDRDISDDWIRRYSEINQTYWKRLEKGEVTKPQVLRGRFADLFPDAEDSADVKGVLGPVPGVIGTLQAIEAIKVISGCGEPLDGRLLSINLLNMNMTEIEL